MPIWLINKGSNLLTSISGGLVKDGIVCWVSVEKYGKLYAIFAPANEIKEDAESSQMHTSLVTRKKEQSTDYSKTRWRNMHYNYQRG